jgi:hypothetical protein
MIGFRFSTPLSALEGSLNDQLDRVYTTFAANLEPCGLGEMVQRALGRKIEG